MRRKDFLFQSSLLAGLGLLPGNLSATPTPPIAPVLLPPLPPLDHQGAMAIRTIIRSEMTGGVYSNVETAVAPKIMGPPPHWHKELDELMLVLEGTASVLVGDEIVQVQAGGWHLRPRNILHTFWNAGETPLRFIDMYFNQPFERYLERIFDELTVENGFADGSDAKNRELAKLNEDYGLVFPENAFSRYDEIKAQFGLK
jgi:mannose-6-phosphate isomerase-like protein (cupin superfamily)